jgi:hypothetical protein
LRDEVRVQSAATNRLDMMIGASAQDRRRDAQQMRAMTAQRQRFADRLSPFEETR